MHRKNNLKAVIEIIQFRDRKTKAAIMLSWSRNTGRDHIVLPPLATDGRSAYRSARTGN